jgi:hypothetical protein
MKKMADVRLLRSMAEVRSVQQRAAEMVAALAGAALQRATSEHQDAVAGLVSCYAGWEAAAQGPRLDLNGVNAWSAAISRGRNLVGEAEIRRQDAANEKSSTDRAWATARARAEVVDRLLKREIRELQRGREETAAGESADRAARNGVRT